MEQITKLINYYHLQKQHLNIQKFANIYCKFVKTKIMKNIIYLFAILPIFAFSQCWQSVDAGENHTLAIKTDGSLWSWGSNNFFKLGYDTPSGINPNPVRIGTSNDWFLISAGKWHSAAIKTDGTLWAWGYNYFGQIGQGNGGTNNAIVGQPTQIGSDTNWQSVSVGTNYTLAIKNDGTLWGTGTNQSGELGIGSPIAAVFMTQIGTDANWKQVSAGGQVSLGLKLDGTLWSWGTGYLGNGNTTTSNIPIQLGVENNWQKISKETGSAIKTNGTLWSWGLHSGNGTLIISTVPTQIGSSSEWQFISAGLGIKTNGTLWSWGLNDYGQLGNGNLVDNHTATQIGNGTNWNSISSGYYFNTATRIDGRLYTWGKNSSGELGDGTVLDKNIPTQVSCLPLNLKSFSDNSFIIYPNPSKDFIHIKKNDNLIIDQFIVIDIFGKVVIDEKNINGKLNIQQLPNGIYLLQINCQNRKFNYKFIKE